MPRDKRVVLINSNNHDFQKASPLGLMIVATLLMQRFNIVSEIVDLPLEDQHHGGLSDFVNSLNLTDPLFVGFSTMCNTLPRTLSIARQIKISNPTIPIVFGGPEASANAEPLIETYDFIDCVVVGEAESVLEFLVEDICSPAPNNRPGLVFRQSRMAELAPQLKHLKPVPERMAPLPDLDDLPLIDYKTYPYAAKDAGVAFDVGRGCPYGCTFCSTKDFFRRRFRLKSTGVIIEQIRAIMSMYNVTKIDFIHDMFTTNRKLVVEVCENLLESKLGVRWACSARTDRVDEELLGLMASSGCRDIFFGLETGSKRIQKLIHKNLDLDDAFRKVLFARDLGIAVTASLIIGFPQETECDLAATTNLVLKLRALSPKVQNVQVHMLSPLSGTELTTLHHKEILFDGHITDITSVNYFTSWEREQIVSHANLFSSFYYLPNPLISRATYKFLYWVLFFGARFEDFFCILFDMFGQKTGELLIDWAKREGDAQFDEFDHRLTTQSVPRLFERLCWFVHGLSSGEEEKDFLLNALRFDFWKNFACQYPGAEELHIANYDFLAMDEAYIREMRTSRARSKYAYAVDYQNQEVKCVEIPFAWD